MLFEKNCLTLLAIQWLEQFKSVEMNYDNEPYQSSTLPN